MMGITKRNEWRLKYPPKLRENYILYLKFKLFILGLNGDHNKSYYNIESIIYWIAFKQLKTNH